MAGLIGKIVFKKILGETVANKKGTEDPYFEYVPASDIKHKPSKKLKRQKKPLPEGITEHEAKVLTKVKRRAYRLDNNINICGLRFGWSSIIGIVPGFGDLIDMALAVMVFRTCCEIKDLSSDVKGKMMFNICIDFAVGLIPFLGDVADAMFRCNTKNAVLLEKFLTKKYNKDKPRRRTENVEMTRPSRHDTIEGPPPDYTSRPGDADRNRDPRRPERAVTNKSKKSARWYGGRGTQEPDLERAEEPEYEYRPAQPPRPRP